MANNVIGFCGIEAYDLILYLSRILFHLDRKVLLVDYAENNGLEACIPPVDQIDVSQNIIHYNGVSFTRMMISEEMILEYSDILINFGFTSLEDMVHLCTEMTYVTDQQKHHIEALMEYSLYLGKREIILRNIVHGSIDEQYLKSKFEGEAGELEIYLMYYDDRDIRSGLLSQYNSKFIFTRISKELKGYLRRKINQLYPSETQKNRRKAYRAAERGK